MQTIIDKLLLNENEIIDLLFYQLTEKIGLNLTYFNQHSFNIVYSDKEFKRILENDFFIYSDGMGILLLIKYLKRTILDKFNATDLNERFLDLFESKQVSYFFIGGDFEDFVISNFMKNKKYYRGYQKGYDIDEKNMIKSIIDSDASVIFIGMGVPTQEKLAHALSQNLDNKIFICVGNFLEFYFGTVKRAPKFLRNSGFEWVYRIITEPIRLWKRYIIGIPLFLLRALKLKLAYSFSKNKVTNL